MTERKAELLELKAQLVSYLHSKIKIDDWHAVQDAASDIREVDAKLELLQELGEASAAGNHGVSPAVMSVDVSLQMPKDVYES